MKTWDVHDADGRIVAFEVPSSIGRSGAQRVARRIPGAKFLAVDSSRPEGTFCEFEVEGVRFLFWEPFGDNSRFWIGSDPVRPTPELATVRSMFAATSWLAAIFGFAA